MLDGEVHYRIAAYQRLAPFLVSLPSDTDLWMFIASGGGLTAGRGRCRRQPVSLRDRGPAPRRPPPHRTADPDPGRTAGRPSTVLWEPFAPGERRRSGPSSATSTRTPSATAWSSRRSTTTLGLAFRYRWSACDEFGWVRTATLENRGAAPVRGTFLDGLRNVLPYGAPLPLYQQASNLVDAYKKSEVDPETGLGIFSLTAGITDRAEALEVLRANTVWCCGLEEFRVHLSLDGGRRLPRTGACWPEDTVLNGARGNYLVSSGLDLEPGRAPALAPGRRRGPGPRADRRAAPAHPRRRRSCRRSSTASLRQAGENLRRNVASADGLQLSGRRRVLEPSLRQRAVQQHARRGLRPEPRRAGRRFPPTSCASATAPWPTATGPCWARCPGS